MMQPNDQYINTETVRETMTVPPDVMQTVWDIDGGEFKVCEIYPLGSDLKNNFTLTANPGSKLIEFDIPTDTDPCDLYNAYFEFHIQYNNAGHPNRHLVYDSSRVFLDDIELYPRDNAGVRIHTRNEKTDDLYPVLRPYLEGVPIYKEGKSQSQNVHVAQAYGIPRSYGLNLTNSRQSNQTVSYQPVNGVNSYLDLDFFKYIGVIPPAATPANWYGREYLREICGFFGSKNGLIYTAGCPFRMRCNLNNVDKCFRKVIANSTENAPVAGAGYGLDPLQGNYATITGVVGNAGGAAGAIQGGSNGNFQAGHLNAYVSNTLQDTVTGDANAAQDATTIVLTRCRIVYRKLRKESKYYPLVVNGFINVGMAIQYNYLKRYPSSSFISTNVNYQTTINLGDYHKIKAIAVLFNKSGEPSLNIPTQYVSGYVAGNGGNIGVLTNIDTYASSLYSKGFKFQYSDMTMYSMKINGEQIIDYQNTDMMIQNDFVNENPIVYENYLKKKPPTIVQLDANTRTYIEDVEFLQRAGVIIHSWDNLMDVYKRKINDLGEAVYFDVGCQKPNITLEIKTNHTYQANRVVDVVVIGEKKLFIKGASCTLVV